MFTEKIKVVIDVVTQNAKKSISDFKKEIQSAEGITGKFGAAVTGLGTLVMQNAAAIGTAAVAVVGGMYKMAEGAAETEAAFSSLNQIAGEVVANKVAEWAEDGAKQFGMSDRDIYKYSTALANIGTSVGMAEEELEGFIGDHLALAADLAAFAETTPDQVMRDMQSAYAGSSETLQKYGIFVNDTEIKQAIFNETGKKITGTLTAQERVLGINIKLMEKGADVAGQWSRESDSLQGQQARLKATMTNISDAIGRGVLPAFEKLAGVLNDNADALEDVAESAGEAIGALGEVVGAAAEVKNAIEQIPGAEFWWEHLSPKAWVDRSLEGLGFVKDGVGDLVGGLKDLFSSNEEVAESTNALTQEYKDAWAEAAKAKEETDALADANKRNETAQRDANNYMAKGVSMYEDIKVKAEAARQKVAEMAIDVQNLGNEWEIMAGKLSDEKAWLEINRKWDEFHKKAERTETDLIDIKIETGNFLAEVAKLPPEVVTEIVAEIDENSLADIQARINQVTAARSVPVSFFAAQNSPQAKAWLEGRHITTGIDRRAVGGSATGGLTVVGERGPELVNLPTGSQVTPAHKVASTNAPQQTIIYNQYFPYMRAADTERLRRRFEKHNGPSTKWR